MERIYLDYAATTPMHDAVINEMTESMQQTFGNPSSIHQFGRSAHSQLEAARRVIAKSIQANEHEIVFNSGGTEGDNTAIMQTAETRHNLGKHIITTKVEHHAVMHTMSYLEKKGFEVTYLDVDQKGNLSVEQVESALRKDTILVSIMFANNETGNLFPIAEIGELLETHQAYFHTDAVQAYGTEEVDVRKLKVDLLSVSAHKISGPRGVGFLYIKDGTKLLPLFHGGDQEEKRRSGTENLAGIVGFAKAVSLLDPATKGAHQVTYQGFQDSILESLAENQLAYEINGDLENKLSSILNIWFKGISNDLLLLNLDLQGIAISTGSACTAGNVEPSHVLIALDHPDSPRVSESVRISFGPQVTKAEIDDFKEILITTIKKLQKK